MLDQLRSRCQAGTSRALADAVSGAIRDGVLADGDRMPPIRKVAAALDLSPTTVNAAWALLVRGGLLRTDGRRGTVVALRSSAIRGGGVRVGSINGGPKGAGHLAGLTRYRQALDRSSLYEWDYSTGVADSALLPDLTAALGSALRRRAVDSYLEEAALPELAEVLREDWPYQPEQFAIVDGAMDAMDQVVFQLLRFGDTVIVEHPAFPPLLDLLETAGVHFVGVGMDGEGLVVDEFTSVLTADVRAVFLQPRAQNPTGISYSPSRIRALAEVLEDTDPIIVEDDSAGAVSSSPAVSFGAELPNRTLHIRSYSKSHGPDLRLAAMSGPAALIEGITERRRLGQGWTSRLLQSVLLDLLTRPASVAQVERARAVYAERRLQLVNALATHGVEMAARDGINMWFPVIDETAALLRLAGARIGVAAGRPFAAKPDIRAHLRITCGLITGGHEWVAAELAAAGRLPAWRGSR